MGTPLEKQGQSIKRTKGKRPKEKARSNPKVAKRLYAQKRHTAFIFMRPL